MLVNAIWSQPAADRTTDGISAPVYYRCGSQSGRPAVTLPLGLSQDEFDAHARAFVVEQLDGYRRLVAGRGKNATRILKKYFDAAQVDSIVRAVADVDGPLLEERMSSLADRLLRG